MLYCEEFYYSNSYLANRREILKHLVEEFLLSEVFEERFVKQYMKRADCVQDIENFVSGMILPGYKNFGGSGVRMRALFNPQQI